MCYALLSLQIKHAIPCNTMLHFGNFDMTFDLDFSQSSSNEAEFELEVRQDCGTTENSIRMKFDVSFEARLKVSIS